MRPESLKDLALQYYETYGNVIGIYLGTKAFAVVIDPQDIEVILSSSVHIEKSVEYK